MYGIHILVTQLTPKKSQLCQFTKSSTGKKHIPTLIGKFSGYEPNRITGKLIQNKSFSHKFRGSKLHYAV